MELESGKPADGEQTVESVSDNATSLEVASRIDWGSTPDPGASAFTSGVGTDNAPSTSSDVQFERRNADTPSAPTSLPSKSYAHVTSPHRQTPSRHQSKSSSSSLTPSELHRHSRTFIVRRAPPQFTCQEVIKTVSGQFRMPASALFERVLRDPKDRRRFYLTFISPQLKSMVESQGFTLGSVTIKPSDGSVDGYIPYPPYYVDISTLDNFIRQSGQLMSSSFVCTEDGIRIAGYKFTLKPRQGALPPREFRYGECTMAVRYADDLRQCDFCGGYGHTVKYCRKKLASAVGPAQPSSDSFSNLNTSSLSNTDPSQHGDHNVTNQVEKRDDVFHDLRKEILGVHHEFSRAKAEHISDYWHADDVLLTVRSALFSELTVAEHNAMYVPLLLKAYHVVKKELQAESDTTLDFLAGKASDNLQPLMAKMAEIEPTYPSPDISAAYDYDEDDSHVVGSYPPDIVATLSKEYRRRLELAIVRLLQDSKATWCFTKPDGGLLLTPRTVVHTDPAPPSASSATTAMEVESDQTTASETSTVISESISSHPPSPTIDVASFKLQNCRPMAVPTGDLPPELEILKIRADDVDPIISSKFCVDFRFTTPYKIIEHFRKPIMAKYSKMTSAKRQNFTPYGITFIPTISGNGGRAYLLDDLHRKFFAVVLKQELSRLPLAETPTQGLNPDYMEDDPP